MARCAVSRRGRRAGYAGTGITQEPGRPLVSTDDERYSAKPRLNGLGRIVTLAVRSEHGSQRWYALARQRAGGDGRGEIGARHSTDEAGERYRADRVEGRVCRLIEPLERHMTGTQQPETMSTQQQRIAQLGQAHPERVFVCLAHHIRWLVWIPTAAFGASGTASDPATAPIDGRRLGDRTGH